jgi:ABC-type sugar transport system permease subunit
VLIALIWTYVGFYFIILLSGADKIPQDLYEVAKIEGANRFQTFFKVTVPLIWDVLVIGIVLWIIGAIKLFEFLFSFSGGTMVPQQIWTNAVYMFLVSFGKRIPMFKLGYGTAIAVTLLLLIIILTGIARLVTRRERIEY